MKRLFLMLFSLFVFSANAASTSELLVQNINQNSDCYICSYSELDGKEYKEIVVCVEGKKLKSIELINLWISNFNIGSSTQEEHERLVERGERLIPNSTYVMSVKVKSEAEVDSEFIYMTAFCSDCKNLKSASILDDQSSFVFEKLKVISREEKE